ncbi:glutathione S-transferase family protein [Sphingomonas sp. SUN019]|uniref:glutathione S-transferase family protein n=1 Tax=Sphingomonas sp. SUN019 TaxID=2937788 RepID=UPI00216426AE|nr:glutathione S-transferase family protein [Sphingomonas sp. SUN019]UVO51996.1 glutathione S-transferase family protein [Sphingomonas sp. SUN019]
MLAGPTDLIVHQYSREPAFSVKTRLMLGFKSAEWFACDHSTILPKPELAALTGGYRQIPVLQVGADIYCGSELVLDQLEARVPQPSLTRASGPGIGRGLAYWAEDNLFWLIVQIVCGSGFESTTRPDFDADRKQMLPGIYDVEQMRAALSVNVPLLRAQLDLLERQLADGRSFLFGDAPDLADISFYFPLDFLRHCRNGNERIPDDYPAIAAWMIRVAAIGHGRRHPIDRAGALAVARAATPTIAPVSTIAEGPQPGDRVRVKWAAYSPIELAGELIEAHPRRIAVLWSAPEVGDVVVHLPRSAGELT